MKLITAIIKPQKLDAIKEALVGAGITGMTVSEAKGFGRQLGLTEVYRGAQYKVDLIPKIRLEILVSSKETDKVIKVIVDAANSLSASLSKTERGCFGFGEIDESGTSPRSAIGCEVPESLIGVGISESRFLPKPPFLVDINQRSLHLCCSLLN